MPLVWFVAVKRLALRVSVELCQFRFQPAAGATVSKHRDWSLCTAQQQI